MISLHDAWSAIAAIAPLDLHRDTPLTEALGRWTAAPVRLDRDQPPFDRATMDGYAVCLGENVATFAVVGTVLAGSAWTGGDLRPGQAVRIMTGAPAPRGTTVVPVEATDRGEISVTVTEAAALRERRNIAWQGEDGRAGSIIVPAGHRLAPATLAVAAMCGATTVSSWVPPRCVIVTTGDEVGGSGDAAIADSNGPLLGGILRSLGIPFRRSHASDDAEDLERVLRHAAVEGDLIITTGGVSAGAKDLVPDLATALGFATVFHHVAIQPGKPVFLAQRDAPRGSASLLVGLPGNPVSVLATAHLILLPLIGRFLGGWTPRWQQRALAIPAANPGKRHLFLPARETDAGIAPIRWNGSGDLIAAAAGDGLVDLPVGFTAEAGAAVRYLPYVGGSVGEAGLMPR